MGRPPADHQGDGITIAEAARVLGVSENAIRQRIKRQSITARKIDNIWRIHLDDQQPSQSADHEVDYQPNYQATTSPTDHDYQADQEATSRTVAINPAALAQVEAIRDQWLQPLVEQLNEKSTQIGRLEERLSATETARDAAVHDAKVLRVEIEALRAKTDQPQPRVEPPLASRTGQGEAKSAQTTTVRRRGVGGVES